MHTNPVLSSGNDLAAAIARWATPQAAANAPELQAVLAELKPRNIPAGSILVRPGEVARECYFVLKGCLRLFSPGDDGTENSAEFYAEGDSVTILEGYRHGRPSRFGIEALEDCQLLAGDRNMEDRMTGRHGSLQPIIHRAMEEEIARRQDAIARFRALSPQDRYLDFLERRPGLAARVPQHQLASHLGMTPESLSRIKKRLYDGRRT